MFGSFRALTSRPRYGRFTWPQKLVLVLGIALLARATLLVYLGGGIAFGGDTPEYLNAARSIVAGDGLGSSVRAPVYPYLLAAATRWGGSHRFLLLRGLQLLVSLGTVWLTMILARRLGGEVVAVLAGLVAAVSPSLIFITGLLYPTAVYTFLLLAATACAAAAARSPRWQAVLGLGLTVAAGVLTDKVFLVPALALLGWALVIGRSRRALIAISAAAVLGFGGAAGIGHAVTVASADAPTKFMAKAQAVLFIVRTELDIAPGHRIRLPADSKFEVLGAKAFLTREKRLFLSQPGAWILDYGQEFLHFFKPKPDRIQTQNRFSREWVLLLAAVSFAPIPFLALLGWLRGRAPRPERWLLALIPLATAALYAFFFTQARYRIPVTPHLIILAALGFLRLLPPGSREPGPDPPGEHSVGERRPQDRDAGMRGLRSLDRGTSQGGHAGPRRVAIRPPPGPGRPSGSTS